MIQAFERAPRQAIVIGGSMAGLLAARVLSDHFERVTLIERDVLPDGPTVRPGVPQMRHYHALLGRGQQLLEKFFPGIGQELAEAGAQRFDLPTDSLWRAPGGWGERYSPGLSLISCSRALLEWQVRQRVCRLPRVHVLDGHIVTGLLASGDARAVAGVRVRPRPPVPTDDTEHSAPMAATVSAESDLAADLVVDASGRDSHLPRWLESFGYPMPPETRINPYLGYASRVYTLPAEVMPDWKFLVVQLKPPQTRGAVVAQIEDGKWIVLLVGTGRDYPPNDEAGFLAFAEGLSTSLVAEFLRAAQPITPVYGYRRTENRQLHYEKVSRRPERLLVMGDAAVAFNPAYGQGMSVAAIEANLLDTWLRDQRQRQPNGDLTGLSARFQRGLAKATAMPWLMATGQDLLYPTTDGPRVGAMSRLIQRYVDLVLQVAKVDPVVGLDFWRVIHFLAPMSTLFSPSVVWRTWQLRNRPALPVPPTRTSLRQLVPALPDHEPLGE